MKKEHQAGQDQNKETEVRDPEVAEKNGQPEVDEQQGASGDTSPESKDEQELAKISKELEDSKEKYLRLYSEFENYRRRTAKEKLSMVQTANEDLMLALLPILDDFERAQKAVSENQSENAAQEGLNLIHDKLVKALDKKGLKGMDDKEGSSFDAELHEAISQFPVEKKKLKGKIVDVIERGYKLGDKVIRFAKVVIGS